MVVLPGLYVALLALALGWALWRWYDPVPPRILALFALLPFLLFGRALLGGEVLLPVGTLPHFVPYRQLPPSERPFNGLQGDLIRQIAPWQAEVRRAVADGRWPLWNANAGAGMPLMGDPQSQSFQPLVAAAWPFGRWEAVGITAALRTLAALVFLFLLLRKLGLGEPAAVLGALAYGLGGFLQLWLGWPMANAAALLPLGLYAVLRVDDPGGVQRGRDLFLLFLAGFGLFLGGHPESVVYALALVGLFLAARAFARRSPRLLLRGGAALALAGLAAAPVLLPVQEYIPASERSLNVSYMLAPRSISRLWRELEKPETLAFWRERVEKRLLPVAAPRAFGDFTFYWGELNIIEDSGGFVGSATLLLTLCALIPGRNRFPHEGFAAGVLIACLLLLAQPPGFENFFARLPVVGPTALHRHHRTLMLVALCASWLAACEAERWRRGEGKRALAVGMGVVLAGLIAWGYLAHPHPTIAHFLAGPRTTWMATQLAVLALGTALLFLRVRPAAWLLALVTAGELLFLHGPANPSSPRRLAYPVTPPIRFLQERMGTDRIVALGASVLPANFHEVYGLNDVRIDNPSLPDRYARVVRLVSRGSALPNFGRVAHPLYDLLGVRYVMTRPGVELPPPLRPVFRHPAGRIYERPDALPRLFLPVRAQIFRGNNWQHWLDTNPDFAARALVQSAPRDRSWRARAPRLSRLELLSVEPVHLRVRVYLGERRLLASSVFHDGNWHVLDGGERRDSIVSNGPFVAAWLPPGEREVDLVYRPRSFVLGCLLSALAFAVAAMWWVPRPQR